jgi:MoxR-like ATPase
VRNLEKVLLGAPGALTAAAICALSGGHLLIEDVPGVGKTVLAKAIALSIGADLARIQGHADLLPSDVTGSSVFSPEAGTWEFHPGPVFARVVLFDEINRTPPRTQSALLESMEEQQVTVDGTTHPLPSPHVVLATQNPRTELGTFPLVESQLDRFALVTSVGYPDSETEVRLAMGEGGRPALANLQPVCDTALWAAAQHATAAVAVTEPIAEYAVAISRGTRRVPGVRLGASPRAALWLVRCAQAFAALSGRDYTVPGDVKAVAVASLSHRIATDGGAGAATVVRSVLVETPAPRP